MRDLRQHDFHFRNATAMCKRSPEDCKPMFQWLEKGWLCAANHHFQTPWQNEDVLKDHEEDPDLKLVLEPV